MIWYIPLQLANIHSPCFVSRFPLLRLSAITSHHYILYHHLLRLLLLLMKQYIHPSNIILFSFQGMRVGGTRRLRIPPSLAYGDRGAKDAIPPGSHLEFECQLVSIASNQLEETFSQINMQPERLITAGLLLILFIVSPTFN
mmetsp:Transcript_39482/g.55625  ORF Transcript_39482/g.55625 Transcript_39482/m.55625 type:complete len:142 (+) Transcript_39482:157-582(+)